VIIGILQSMVQKKNIRMQGDLRCNSGFGLVDTALKNIGIIQLFDYYLQE
jgi:hypothetical protein